MNEIKAIETVYNGYRFRSRLEARWAVFFDAAGIKYEYEIEGFDLGKYRYLPDFYLPWWNCYVEIKPDEKEAIAAGEKCCIDLFEAKPGIITMLCAGDPMNGKMWVYCYDMTEDSGGGTNEWSARFLEGPQWENREYTKHSIAIVVDGYRRDRTYHTSDWGFAKVENDLGLEGYRSDFQHAKLKARQARFEHGETPKA